jgi:hypothetical protein
LKDKFGDAHSAMHLSIHGFADVLYIVKSQRVGEFGALTAGVWPEQKELPSFVLNQVGNIFTRVRRPDVSLIGTQPAKEK